MEEERRKSEQFAWLGPMLERRQAKVEQVEILLKAVDEVEEPDEIKEVTSLRV